MSYVNVQQHADCTMSYVCTAMFSVCNLTAAAEACSTPFCNHPWFLAAQLIVLSCMQSITVLPAATNLFNIAAAAARAVQHYYLTHL